jgi:hypothetical protein
MPRASDARLFVVASPGRSGTSIYSRLLTTPRSTCFHELTSRLRRYPANVVAIDRLEHEAADHHFEAAQRRLVLEAYPTYFGRMWEHIEGGCCAVGNSDHLSGSFLSGLWLVWPRMRFLLSLQNGIDDVDGSVRHGETTSSAAAMIRRLRFGTSDAFEQCCHDWAASVARLETHRDWLLAHDAPVLETRLESVLSDTDEVQRVRDWLIGGGDEGAESQPDGDGPRSTDEIWAQWPPEQRRVFAEICGATQARLGYSLPDSGGS